MIKNTVGVAAAAMLFTACGGGGSGVPVPNNGFPVIEISVIDAALAGAMCGVDSSARSPSVATHTDTNTTSGIHDLNAFPVRLCVENTTFDNLIFWSGTNAAGNQLRTVITNSSGQEFHISDGGFDTNVGVNFVSIELTHTDGNRFSCHFVKPPGGIAPLQTATCVSSTQASYGCNTNLNADLLGRVGISGRCANKLIVDRTMLDTAISAGQTSGVFAVTGNDGNAYSFDQLYVGNITNMGSLFNQVANFNEDISAWDVSNVTTMSGMFSEAEAFNQDIGDWDVSSVTNMRSMFSSRNTKPTDFNQDIGDWDVSGVTDMSAMFNGAVAFNKPIDHWDVSNVTNMSLMFCRAETFNQDLGNWNVAQVTTMEDMFCAAFDFDQDISSWDVSKVENMDRMFHSAAAFDQDLSGWQVCKVTSYDDFAGNSPLENQTNKHPAFGAVMCPSAAANVNTQNNTVLNTATHMPAEPGNLAASIDQAYAAQAMHTRLLAAGQPNRQSGSAPLDWYDVGLHQAQVSGNLSGEGTFVYALVGNDVEQPQGQSLGFAFGLERGNWEYTSETDVTKTGASVGVYGGRTIGSLEVSGSLMGTAFANEHTNQAGGTATSRSLRVMGAASISQSQNLTNGSSFSPYASLNYTRENLGSYSYDGGSTVHESANTTLGQVSLGVRYATANWPGVGRLTARVAVERAFASAPITLSNSATYQPGSSTSAEIALGWQSDLAGEGISTIDLTFTGLGDASREDVRLNGTWERSF